MTHYIRASSLQAVEEEQVIKTEKMVAQEAVILVEMAKIPLHILEKEEDKSYHQQVALVDLLDTVETLQQVMLVEQGEDGLVVLLLVLKMAVEAVQDMFSLLLLLNQKIFF